MRCDAIRVADDEVKWRLTHALTDLAAKRITQTFALTQGRLAIEVDVEGDADAVALHVPCLTFDGEAEAAQSIGDTEAVVRFRGATFAASVPRATRVHVDDAECASRQAAYRVVTYEALGTRLTAELRLTR